MSQIEVFLTVTGTLVDSEDLPRAYVTMFRQFGITLRFHGSIHALKA